MSQAPDLQNQNHAMENQDISNPILQQNYHLANSEDQHEDFQLNQISSQRQKFQGQNANESSKHGWTREDQLLLYRLHDRIGNKWAIIAHQMKQRTDNCVKNHFYSKLRKALRKLNKGIHDYYRKQYKEIKMSAFYKIIQATEQGHKAHSNIQGSVSDYCKDLKNRLLRFADQFDEKSLQTIEGRQIAKKTIKQVVQFNRHYKRQSKKKRKCSGNDGAIYPHYFKTNHIALEDHMSQDQSDDIFYSNSSKNQKNKEKQSPQYQENPMEFQIYQQDDKPKANKQDKMKLESIQPQARAYRVPDNDQIATPTLLRVNSKASKFSGRYFEQQPQIFFQESYGIYDKNPNYTLFEHLIKPDASQNL